jgi:hypothetical protein
LGWSFKFPSFTDNACNSLTLDAVANAIKNTVFHVKNFTSQEKRGSKGGSHNLQSTNLSDPPHGDCIPLDGKYLVAGVLKGKSVPLQLL